MKVGDTPKIVGKEELVRRITERAGKTKKDTAVFLDALLGEVTEALAADEEVRLVGFGSLRVRELAARQGKDPRTGRDTTIPARRAVRFTPGKELRAATEKSPG